MSGSAASNDSARQLLAWHVSIGFFVFSAVLCFALGIVTWVHGFWPGTALFAVVGLFEAWRATTFYRRRPAATRLDVVTAHMLVTSDPTLRAVFAEDAAALIGIVIATAGVGLHQITGSSTPDGVGSLLVRLLLAVTSVVLIDRNRRFLVGEAVQPEIRAAALSNLLSSEEIQSVSYLHLEYSGPQRAALLARLDLVEDAPESMVAATIGELERRIEARPGISRAVLALSHPGSAQLSSP